MSDTRYEEAERLRQQGLDVEAVGEILERSEGNNGATVGRDGSAPFDPPRLETYTPPVALQPGLHFGVPHDAYLAFPALSNHGIKALAASSMIFWQNCAWMNAEYEQPEEKDHFNLGNAYETRIFKGEAAFDASYAVALNRRDYPGALVTGNDIKEKLGELGITPKGTSKAGWMTQLREFDPDAQLWEELVERHAESCRGKTMISAAAMQRIAITARIVELDEAHRAATTGGWPSVVLVWHCVKTGVLMKAEIDYMKLAAIVDAKTLVNQRMRSADAAAFREIADRRYTIQPSVYSEGTATVRQMVREHSVAAIFHHDNCGEEVQFARDAWAHKWANHRQRDDWFFLFMQTAYPITRLVQYPLGGTNAAVSGEIVSRMKRRFRQMSETYGVDPWLDLEGLVQMTDEDVPPYALEI